MCTEIIDDSVHMAWFRLLRALKFRQKSFIYFIIFYMMKNNVIKSCWAVCELIQEKKAKVVNTIALCFSRNQ